MIPTTAFPDHNLDPRKKDDKWILQYAKAAWSNFTTSMPHGSIFYAKAERYQEIRDYAMNKQNIDKYKKELLGDNLEDGAYMRIDWTPRGDASVLRNIAVAKIQKAGYNILATPINQYAKDAEDEKYAELKAKILMRDALEKRDPSLADSPELKRLPGEPEDLEELKMQVDFNPKLVRAKDIEESVQLVFYENDMEQILNTAAEDFVDYGVGIVKEGLDANNKVILRKVAPGRFICSYTEQSDFSDITYAGELISVKLSDLAKVFDSDKIEELKNKVAGKNGNPSALGENTVTNNGYDIFKVDVLDIEFISYNKRVTEENKDKNGNLRISKTDPKNENKNALRYTAKAIEVVYKAKWVIGTDLLYEEGLAENQKRSVEIAHMSKTRLSYHIMAASFNKMRARGLTEDMIGIMDDLNMATYRLRNYRNRMIPNGYDIDLNALENVALGGGGEPMKPLDVLDMFAQTGILINRRSGQGVDSNINYKAVNPIANNMADQMLAIARDIQDSKQALRDITGLNELTDGSTPNPKTLTTIANLANESTNNALYYLVGARKKLLEATAKGVIQRLQVALKRGPYDGFDKSAGRWISVPKSIMDYDYDIMIEDRPSDEQKQMIYDMMREDIKNGFISHSEVISAIYTNNLKSLAIVLSYKVEKGKQRLQKQAIENTEATSRAQIESNRQAEIIKDAAAERQHIRDFQKMDLEKAWDYMIAKLKVEKKADDEAGARAEGEVVSKEEMPPLEAPQSEQAA